jgi:hypothetical protein
MNFEKTLNNGSKFNQKFAQFCEEQKLNYFKVMCLLWQQNTRIKCRNRNHIKGIYSNNKIECEAQLVEIIATALRMGNYTEQEQDKILEELKRAGETKTLRPLRLCGEK